MSKIALSPNASGTGVFTIASPSGNTDRTLTLPDEAGTVLTNSSDIPAANLTGSLPAGMGGKVLQVVHTSGNTTFISSSGSFVNTPQNISITPVSSSSKIIVQMVNAVWSPSGSYMYMRIQASGGASGTIVSWGDIYRDYYGNTPVFGVHSNHNTTSQITYTLQGRSDTGGFWMPNNNGNPDASTRYMSIVWEIAS